MKEISIGVQITDEGLAFSGTDEVNSSLKRGYQVASMEPGEAMVQADPEEATDEGEEVLTLAGFSVTVALKAPAKGGGRTPT